MWLFLLILPLQSAFSNEIFALTDQCTSLCKENDLPALDLVKYEQIVCQRGCRYFNIIRFKEELNLNMTKKECYLSCNESYLESKENEVCIKGCDLMSKKCENDFPLILLTEDEDSDNIVLAEPDLEILETEILSDPSIRSQLEIGFNIDYKIPETHIRTMPIEMKDIKPEYSGDWLDCASRNSGIPRWILLTAFLSAVLVALWLSFSTEKRSPDDILNIADDKLILTDEEKIPDFEYLCPPKYTVESEKV